MVRKEYAQSVRTALAALLFGLLAVTSGCFSGDVNLVVNDDGSADLKTTLVSVPMLAEIVEQSKAAAVEKNPDAQVTPVTKDNNMSGYEISEHYATLDKLSDVDFFAAHEGKNAGITAAKSFFYDDWNFDLIFSGTESGGGAGAFASNITFTYEMTLPVTPTSSNADRISDDGKTLTWNLGKTLTTGESTKIEVAFRMWHKPALIGTAALLFLLVAGTAYAVLRRKKSPEDAADGASQNP